MKTLAAILATVGLCVCTVRAHTLSEETVLVDTDAGLDDLRALALLLDLPGIDVLAVVTGDGSARADSGARLVQEFLRRLGREEILVLAAGGSPRQPPPWRPLYDALAARLPELAAATPAPDWKGEIERLLSRPGPPVTVLALGPLTNLAALLQERPHLANRLSRIVWYGKPPGAGESFNRDFDLQAVEQLFASGIPLLPVSSAPAAAAEPVFDRELLAESSRGTGRKQEALQWLLDLPEARERLAQGHLRLWDEAAALFLVRPEAFSEKEGVWVPEPDWLRSALIYFFRGPAGTPPAHDNESFDRFPFAREFFRADLAQQVPELISRHGPDEFRGCVLVSELHQHLGIYSIVGVKMGLRARELLGEPDHPLQVASQAGHRPPLSCLNDGLQVGAGATVGLGLIQVEEPKWPRAAATFSHEGRTVRLALKPQVTQRIRQEILALTSKSAGLDAAYYRELRRVALRLWLELDRAHIFDIEAR